MSGQIEHPPFGPPGGGQTCTADGGGPFFVEMPYGYAAAAWIMDYYEYNVRICLALLYPPQALVAMCPAGTPRQGPPPEPSPQSPPPRPRRFRNQLLPRVR